jgi:hypothetical protein
MKVGDLVLASWDNCLAPPGWGRDGGRDGHVGVYLRSEVTLSDISNDNYIILSDSDVISLPSRYWKLEVISESR